MRKALFNDDELWSAVCKDDEMAFRQLFDRYWVRLYNTANNYLKDRETSEEVVHDVFLNIWNRRQELEINSFPNFLLTATRYQVYNRMRAAKPPVVYIADDIEMTASFDSNLAESKISEQELHQELLGYIGQLPKRCLEIFYMSRFDHLSNQEIATNLGISKRTVENQITAALKHLRDALKYAPLVLVCILLS